MINDKAKKRISTGDTSIQLKRYDQVQRSTMDERLVVSVPRRNMKKININMAEQGVKSTGRREGISSFDQKGVRMPPEARPGELSGTISQGG